MSCSVQLKTRNTVKSKKVNNVIHRTTSETIRLGEPEVIINNSSRQVMTTLAISPPPLKKSTCSFQITGVSLTQRTDFGGDDSADDLDESHTDDISRVTDNETPSFSEDTCSRDADDNYIGSCSALCSVTVIPSSSQYGLAIVPSETSAVSIGNVSETSINSLTSKASASTSGMSDITQTSSTKEVPVTTATTVPGTGLPADTASITTSVTSTTTVTTPRKKEMPVTRSARIPGTRFQVVKVETIQPFRRGRWLCMDYLDDSKYTPKNALTYKSPDSPEISCTKPQPQYTMTATTTEANYMNSSTNQDVVQQNVHPMAPQQGHVYNAQGNPCYSNIVRQSQSYSTPISVPTQQLHHGQIDVMQAHSFVRQRSVPETPRTQVSNFVQNQYFQNLPMNSFVTPQQHSHSQQQPIVVQQPITLPCQQNQRQLISGDMYSMQNSQVFYAQPPLNQPVYDPRAPIYASPPQMATSSMQSYSNLVEPGQNHPVTYSDHASGSAQIMASSVMQQSYTSQQAQDQSTSTPTTQQYNIISQTATTIGDSSQVYSPVFVGKRSDSSDSHSSGKTSRSSTRKSSLEPLVEDGSLAVATQVQDLSTSSVNTSVPSSSVPKPEQGVTSTSSPAGYGSAATTAAVQPSRSVLESSSANVSATVATTTIVQAPSGPSNSETRYTVIAEAANNTSAIIDSKIEQAMDLVKSHLMFTVRVEVEELKVRIAELLDRINQLEMENSFLKANASPEVLNALSSRAPQDQAQGNIPSTAGVEGGASSK